MFNKDQITAWLKANGTTPIKEAIESSTPINTDGVQDISQTPKNLNGNLSDGIGESIKRDEESKKAKYNK